MVIWQFTFPLRHVIICLGKEWGQICYQHRPDSKRHEKKTASFTTVGTLLSRKFSFLENTVLLLDKLKLRDLMWNKVSYRRLSVFLWSDWNKEFSLSEETNHMTEKLVHEVQDADSSHSFLLSNHRNPGKPMNTVNIQGSSLGWGTIQLIKLGFSDWLWLESGPDAGSLLGCGWEVQRRDWSPRKEPCLCSIVPGSNYII